MKCSQQRDDTEAIGSDEQARQQREVTAGFCMATSDYRGVMEDVSWGFSPGAASKSGVSIHRFSAQNLETPLSVHLRGHRAECVCFYSSRLRSVLSRVEQWALP